jgi:haloacetate dehalogenase
MIGRSRAGRAHVRTPRAATLRIRDEPAEGDTAGVFDGFTRETVTTSGAEINLVRGGSGPPVLLLHGAPQTHAMWHGAAPALAEGHTVVVADLRGYGDSSKPGGGGDHAQYSFRAMAGDQLEVMRALGFDRFALVGHDRGARVAHRLVRDHPAAVERLALLDILPTDHVYGHVDRALATAYYHWFLLIQPEPLPERLLEPNAIAFLHWSLGSFGSAGSAYAPEALAEYERCFADPAAIHALCEDYRAAASIDLEHDAADRGRRIECPLLLLWGAQGVVGGLSDPLAVWSDYAADVRGEALQAGHFLVEQRPAETLAALRDFLSH